MKEIPASQVVSAADLEAQWQKEEEEKRAEEERKKEEEERAKREEEEKIVSPWVKVFRMIPEFRILRLTFHGKSASKCQIRQILIVSLINF